MGPFVSLQLNIYITFTLHGMIILQKDEWKNRLIIPKTESLYSIYATQNCRK